MPPPFQPGDHVTDYVDDAFHGLLSAADQHYVISHAASCPVCSAALEEARRRLAAFRAAPVPEIPPKLVENIVERTRIIATGATRRQHTIRRWTLNAIIAALIFMAFVHVSFVGQTPSAYDLRLLGQQQLLAGSPASLRVQLNQNNAPVSDAAIILTLHNPRSGESTQLASYRTDNVGTGSPQFTLPDWPDGDYTLHVTADVGFHTESLDQPITLKRDARVMLSTDKPIYQPGQTIHMRALALRRPDFKPFSATDATFTLTDPRGTLIFKQNGVTSPFGITSADCPLAPEITPGAYTLNCRVGTTESTSTVEIKPYQLPKFKIDLTTDKPFYAPGDRVRVTLQTDYFFNQPVANARINLTAGTSTNLHATTDDRGHATLEFVLQNSLPADHPDDGNYRLPLTATVVDSANQEQSRALPLVITTAPIRIELIPESGTLVPNLANRIYALTTYADGRPAKTRLALTGLAPLDTSDLGVAMFELTPRTDRLTITAQATDAAGITATRPIELASAADTGILPAEDYILRTDHATYRTGQTLSIQVFSNSNQPVFIDLIKDGQTMRTATVPLGEGHGALAINLPPTLAGTLQINAYRYDESGITVHKTRLVYVQSADDLRIAVSADHPAYRPGDTARLSFRLTDAKGQPVPGALSLAGVDQAVFSVLDSVPGLEPSFFTRDPQLLQPTYALYPAGPQFNVTDPNADLLNQALFSRAAGTNTTRDQLLARLVAHGQISSRSLRSLNTDWGRRYFDEQIRYLDLPQAVKDTLLSPGLFSLDASTGPENRMRAARIDEQRHELLPFLWGATFVACLITLAAVYGGKHRALELLAVLGLIALLIAILLPSLGKARELSRRSSAAADARGIAQALMVEQNESGLLSAASPNTPAAPRLRQYFPETLLWRPELITDDRGNASLELPLADSITTWRLSASAVSAAGQLGATDSSIRVFQPFFVDLNLPAALTRGDEISLPAVVYNYLPTAQTVTLTLPRQDFFEPLSADTQQIELPPNAVKSLYFRIRALKAGTFNLQLSARAGDTADALQRPLEILPGGQLVESSSSGTLSANALDLPLTLPPNIIDGSLRAQLKIYPSTYSQLAEGLDTIFQMPYGCFEQTSSTTYPNVLALSYLESTKTAAPKTQALARNYINLGYQRLLSFEIPGGGFDWFGNPPAHPTLTAYGLQEFQDMAKVHNVDPALLKRTRDWLLTQQQSDGSWSPGRQFYHDDPTAIGDARLATTAYIAWSVFAHQPTDSHALNTQRYLRANASAARTNAYTTALVALALMAIDPQDSTARDLASSLESSRQLSPDGKLAHWSPTAGRSTAFYGSGNTANIETTALAALLLLQTPGHTTSAHAALSWLISVKDPRGTWCSTQATVLALKALLAGTTSATGDNRERRFALQLADLSQNIRIPADQSDVLRAIDLTPSLKPGTQSLHLQNLGPDVSYQLVLRYNLPGNPPAAPRRDLDIALNFDSTRLTLRDQLHVTATLRNNTPDPLPMILADLPIPPGFAPDTASLNALQSRGTIEKYQLTSRQIIVYLRALNPNTPLQLPYTLRPQMPANVQSPPATVYEYYKPENRGSTLPTNLTIVENN
jgi:uncharacterized protein YfaS (alpha-2-macroglobulin family)